MYENLDCIGGGVFGGSVFGGVFGVVEFGGVVCGVELTSSEVGNTGAFCVSGKVSSEVGGEVGGEVDGDSCSWC